MTFRTSHATWFLVFCVLNVITDAFFFLLRKPLIITDASGITLVLMLPS